MSVNPQQIADAEGVAAAEAYADKPEEPGKQKVREGKSPLRIALERLRRDKIAIACIVVILLFILMAMFQDLITNIVGVDNENHQELLNPETTYPDFTASSAHPLGIEPGTGRDLFYRWVHGARPSLIVGIFAAAVTVIIGVTMGLLSGFLGGWVDRVISWFIDFLLSLPFLLMAFAIVPIAVARFGNPDTAGYVEPGKQSTIQFIAVIFILVLFGWPSLARLIRGEVLSLREREFVQAARALGAGPRRIVFREMLPNLLGPIIVNLTVLIPAFISIEAGMSLLGIGLQDPIVSWGQTISSGSKAFDTYPIWMWVPAMSIALLVLALSLLGDAVSDAFNPQTRR
ncbi:ABC transporter permease [Yimella sp. cx-51]|uniref:ABC transporter permease n=1 Tax=Yimella sp. cx-51 TaxID=2770551 RepID=UPI00165E6BC0|nr:ABC transporter permease [Yimella sp. cx-51]MBC9957532.1 ABC transporter permease [Yimella sp. cx-51]QTH39241.1 ABC transporter permease [Yimella sp. cx-51]